VAESLNKQRAEVEKERKEMEREFNQRSAKIQAQHTIEVTAEGIILDIIPTNFIFTSCSIKPPSLTAAYHQVEGIQRGHETKMRDVKLRIQVEKEQWLEQQGNKQVAVCPRFLQTTATILRDR